MRKFFDILEALFLFYVSWRCIGYYKGWLNLSDEKEERRLRIVSSYGLLLLILGFITLLCGIGILIV